MMKLDIQLFAGTSSGSVNTNGYEGRSVIFNWNITKQDIESNKTTFKYTLKGYGDAESSYYYSGPFLLKIQGEKIYQSSTRIKLYNGTLIKEGTYTIEHNNDGNKSFSVEIKAGIYKSSYNCTASKTFELLTIPRASDVTASDGVINQPILITIDKKNKNYTTKLFYKFEGGDYTSIFDSPIEETQINFILPLSTYDLIPDKKSIKGYIKADTYNQTVKIGDSKETTFIAYANEIACSPGIEDTSILDTNTKTIALTGSNQRFIKYVSKPQLSWNAVAKYESIIKSEKINGVIAESPLITEWADSYKLVVTDSRGFTNTYDFLMENIVPYFLPKIKASGKRENPTSSKIFITLKGKYYVGSFDSANQNQNIKKCICKYKKKTDEEWTQITLNPNVDEDGNFELNNYDLGEICDYSSSWMFEVSIEDSISSDTYSFIINKGIPNHNWYEKGDENYFNVNGYLTIKENMNCLGFNKLGTYEEKEET